MINCLQTNPTTESNSSMKWSYYRNLEKNQLAYICFGAAGAGREYKDFSCLLISLLL